MKTINFRFRNAIVFAFLNYPISAQKISRCLFSVQKRGYSFPDKFLCTLHQCIGEAKGVLINHYGYSEEKANKEINRIIEEFMIEKSPAVVVEDDISVVEEIGQKYGLNEEDVPVIYGFWKLKINIVVVRDNAFESTCKELNINVIRWPSFS